MKSSDSISNIHYFPSIDIFESSFLRRAAQLIIAHPYYDEENHHGELMTRYQEAGGSENLSAVAATIQSGYFPSWLEVPDSAYYELIEHCKSLEKKPWYNLEHF